MFRLAELLILTHPWRSFQIRQILEADRLIDEQKELEIEPRVRFLQVNRFSTIELSAYIRNLIC